MYNHILTRVLKKIKPNVEQSKRLINLATEVLRISDEEARKNYQAKAILAGSLTRNTWLTDKKEIDIFVLFPQDLSEKKLEEYGLNLGKKIIRKLKGKIEIKYAQHPYVTGVVDGFTVEIVPCYALNSPNKIKSAVDRTPFHVQYLNRKFSLALSDDVRLLKQFLKTHDIYGADAKTEGFSGYLCDLLVLNYGKFVNVLRRVQNWKPGEIIDIEEHWSEKDYPKLRKKFKNEVLIIIDPVDKNRNVAAAVSTTNFFKFKKLSKEFLKKPSEQFFFKRKTKPLSVVQFERLMKRRKTELIAVVFKPPNVVPDILWPQLRKTTERIKEILREYEFHVHRWSCWSDEKKIAVILLEMEVWRLPKINEKIGPLVFDIKNSENFIKKYINVAVNGPYIRDNRWIFEVVREWDDARKKLDDSLKKSKKILMAKGIPNHISEQISKRFKILNNEGIRKLLKNEDFGVFLRKYFEKEKLV